MKLWGFFRMRFKTGPTPLFPFSEPHAFAPHCDSSVLHAPGECGYCDLYPDWQRHREIAHIAFTGGPREDEYGPLAPCPSEQRRSLEQINRWPGNRPAGTE